MVSPPNIFLRSVCYQGFLILHDLKYLKRSDTFFLIARGSRDDDVLVKQKLFIQNIKILVSLKK